MNTKHTYNLDLGWQEGRIGLMSSPELHKKITVATPPEFPGGVEGIWSPEHLFTSAVLSCFMTTFLAIAEYSKLEFSKFDCKSEGVLEKVDGKFKMSAITLKPFIELPEGGKMDKAIRLMEKAEAACLISNSITTTVKLDFSAIQVSEPV
ncbi:OsmC family protein [Marivirga harenae]|uniref:OsmC family protein n=1 Tax=Marivirga harenae TaxID=2010992 RepID=UPI0026E0AC6C|nr:OsmC family protein [Marivirga harenae]WKV12945.1 OsmC family protein [Marivirga harenae]|tara:strand:- start:58490 stop:58939 length:450 start_codon:yes stop_codon:yes gene_type:complete